MIGRRLLTVSLLLPPHGDFTHGLCWPNNYRQELLAQPGGSFELLWSQADRN